MTIKLKGSFGPITGAMKVGDLPEVVVDAPVQSGLYAQWDAADGSTLVYSGEDVIRWNTRNDANIYADSNGGSGGSVTTENGTRAISTFGGGYGIVDVNATSFTTMTCVLACRHNQSYPWRLGGTGGGTVISNRW